MPEKGLAVYCLVDLDVEASWPRAIENLGNRLDIVICRGSLGSDI